jgi:hypothetical protein
MAAGSGLFTFVRLPSYVKSAAGLFFDAEEREIERTLCDDPHAGDTVSNTGGVAKLRVKLPGRGKSGSARLIYFYRGSVGRVYLLYAYSKEEADDLSEAGKKEMRNLTKLLEAER